MSDTRLPNKGDLVSVTVTGRVESTARFESSGNQQIVFDDPEASPGYRTVVAWRSEHDADVHIEVSEAAYIPQIGDLASWKSDMASVVPTPIVYLDVNGSKGWYMTGHTTMIRNQSADPASDRFTLLVSGGKPVPAKPEPVYTPKSGDVALWKCDGVEHTIMYRRGNYRALGWFDEDNMLRLVDPARHTFTLVLRDNELQEGVGI